eukprot:3351263-Alexandrium_andersonii.AAC.1
MAPEGTHTRTKTNRARATQRTTPPEKCSRMNPCARNAPGGTYNISTCRIYGSAGQLIRMSSVLIVVA